MRRQAVVSSMLHSIGYDAAHRSLEIEFASGGTVYEYLDVPANEHR